MLVVRGTIHTFVVIFSPPVRNCGKNQTLNIYYANRQKIFHGWLKGKSNGD